MMGVSDLSWSAGDDLFRAEENKGMEGDGIKKSECERTKIEARAQPAYWGGGASGSLSRAELLPPGSMRCAMSSIIWLTLTT